MCLHTAPTLPMVAASGSPPLLATLAGSLLLGIAYSTDLPLLRWKRSPVLAAACILAVRCVRPPCWCTCGRQASEPGACKLPTPPRSHARTSPSLVTFRASPAGLLPQGGAGAAGLLLPHAAVAGVGGARGHPPHRLCHRFHAALQVPGLRVFFSAVFSCAIVWEWRWPFRHSTRACNPQAAALPATPPHPPCHPTTPSISHACLCACSVVIALFKDVPDVAGDSKASCCCCCCCRCWVLLLGAAAAAPPAAAAAIEQSAAMLHQHQRAATPAAAMLALTQLGC